MSFGLVSDRFWGAWPKPPKLVHNSLNHTLKQTPNHPRTHPHEDLSQPKSPPPPTTPNCHPIRANRTPGPSDAGDAGDVASLAENQPKEKASPRKKKRYRSPLKSQLTQKGCPLSPMEIHRAFESQKAASPPCPTFQRNPLRKVCRIGSHSFSRQRGWAVRVPPAEAGIFRSLREAASSVTGRLCDFQGYIW